MRLAHLGKWSRNSNRRKRYNVVFDISGFLKVVLTFPILVFPVIGCNPMRKIFMVKLPKRLVKLTTVRLQVRSIRSQCKCNIRISKVIFPSFLKRIIQIKLLIFILALTFWMVEAFISVWNDSGYYSFVLFNKKYVTSLILFPL